MNWRRIATRHEKTATPAGFVARDLAKLWLSNVHVA